MIKISQDISLLEPELQNIIKKLIEECKNNGLKIKITDTRRDKKEQDQLYAKGRTQSGKKVTNAKYPKSAHNWGVAFDFCRNDGKGAYNDNDNFFYKVGQIGKKYKLDWGGDWKSFKDKPHFEMKKYMPNNSTKELIKKYKTPENFFKTWGNNSSEMLIIDAKYDYNNKKRTYSVINKNSQNYIKVRDVANLLEKEVIFDRLTKNTFFKDKILALTYQYNNKKQKLKCVNIKGENFVKLKDILKFLGYEYQWISATKETIITKN